MEYIIMAHFFLFFAGMLPIYIAARKCIKNSIIVACSITAVYVIINLSISYSCDDDGYLWMIANFAGLEPLACFMMISLAKEPRQWNGLIPSGGYAFVASVTHRTVEFSLVKAAFTRYYRYHFKYTGFDGQEKFGSAACRDSIFSSVPEKMVAIEKLEAPKLFLILHKNPSSSVTEQFKNGIFIKPGTDPRKEIVSDPSLRDKYEIKKTEQN